MSTPNHAGVPVAGLFLGPFAWAISTQLNYVLVPYACGHGIQPIPYVALGCLALALGGGWLSFRAWRDEAPPSPNPAETFAPRQLLAGVGALAGALFALVILLQGAAGLIFTGCER